MGGRLIPLHIWRVGMDGTLIPLHICRIGMDGRLIPLLLPRRLEDGINFELFLSPTLPSISIPIRRALPMVFIRSSNFASQRFAAFSFSTIAQKEHIATHLNRYPYSFWSRLMATRWWLPAPQRALVPPSCARPACVSDSDNGSSPCVVL